MPNENQADLTQEGNPRATEFEREVARHEHRTPRHGLLARLFHPFNTPWTTQTARRKRRPLTTAEMLRVKRSDDR